jgi:hypothetical protein
LKKAASLILIALGIYAVIKAVYFLLPVNHYFAQAGVRAAKEAGFPWIVLAIGFALLIAGLILRLPKRNVAGCATRLVRPTVTHDGSLAKPFPPILKAIPRILSTENRLRIVGAERIESLGRSCDRDLRSSSSAQGDRWLTGLALAGTGKRLPTAEH